MRRGDLVVGNEEGHLRFGYRAKPLIGILLEVNHSFTTEFLQEIIWWDVLREDGVVVQETEYSLRVVE